MTVQDMILQVFQKAGRPTDLDPYDVVAEVPTYTAGNAGWKECVKLLNRAYMKLAAWKLPGRGDAMGQTIRFREFTQTVFFKVADVTTVAATAVNAAQDQITFGTATFTVDLYAGWYVKIGTESNMVISNTATVMTFYRPWTTASASLIGSTATVYKRWFPVLRALGNYPAGQAVVGDGTARLTTPQKINCLGSVTSGGPMNTEVNGADRTLLFNDYPATRTYPTLWRYTNRGIEFSDAPIADTVYKIDFWCEPEQFETDNTPVYATVDAQVPVIPSVWHEVLWQIASWLRSISDKNDVETKTNYDMVNTLIRTTMVESEVLFDNTESFVTVDHG